MTGALGGTCWSRWEGSASRRSLPPLEPLRVPGLHRFPPPQQPQGPPAQKGPAPTTKVRRTMSSRVHEAVKAIALCHNVTPVYESSGVTDQAEAEKQYEDSCRLYQASSPDEVSRTAARRAPAPWRGPSGWREPGRCRVPKGPALPLEGAVPTLRSVVNREGADLWFRWPAHRTQVLKEPRSFKKLY